MRKKINSQAFSMCGNDALTDVTDNRCTSNFLSNNIAVNLHYCIERIFYVVYIVSLQFITQFI